MRGTRARVRVNEAWYGIQNVWGSENAIPSSAGFPIEVKIPILLIVTPGTHTIDQTKKLKADKNS